MRRGFPWLALLACGPATAAPEANVSAEPSEVDSILAQDQIELVDLFRVADLASPVLAAARSDVAAAAGRRKQAGAYANPSVGFDIEEASLEDFDDRKEKIGIAQPLLLGGRPGPAASALEAELGAAERSFDDARRTARGSVHALVVEILHSRALSRTLGELAAEARTTEDIAQKRFDARAAPESHATRALLERYDLELERDRAQADERQAAARLDALLGARIPADRLASPPSLAEEPDTALLAERLASHPGLAAARLATSAAQARERQARARKLPDFEVRAALGRWAALDEGFFEAGVDMTLPIFDRNQGSVDEARADVTRSEQDARRIESELAVELDSVVRRRALVATQLAAHRERVEPAAARGLAQARAGYQAGRLSFLELIDAQQTLALARTRTLELARDFELATAELSALAGLGPYQDDE
jgi:cobalt-zinc-cadmium efflux system outer membrane protein